MSGIKRNHLQHVPMPWKLCADVAEISLSFNDPERFEGHDHKGPLAICASVDDLDTKSLNSHVLFRRITLSFSGVVSFEVGGQPADYGDTFAMQHYICPEPIRLEKLMEDWHSTGLCSDSGILEVVAGQNDEFTIYGERVREFVIDDREYWVRVKSVSFDWSWVEE